MNRFRISLSLSLAAALTAVASCADEGADANASTCDQGKVGDDCSCASSGHDDGKYECSGGKLVCSCDLDRSDGDETDTDAEPEDREDDTDGDGDEALEGVAEERDAGSAKVDSGRRDAGTLADASAEEAGADASAPDDGDDDDDEMGPTSGEGPVPELPAIAGECPEFRDGATLTVAGHRGVKITAGEKGKGGPLVFYWNGTGSDPAREVGGIFPSSVVAEIKASGGIIAGLHGRSSTGSGGDCSGTGEHAINDFRAADQIAACAVKNHGIDPRRIYTTGCSAGGLQAACMASRRSSYIAAAAPNSGGSVGMQPWQSDHTPAVITMHGGAQDVVIVTFSQTSAAYDRAAKAHGSFVVNCDHGGNHCRAPAAVYEAAWKFLKDHPFGSSAMTSPWKDGLPSGVPSQCKIY